MKLQNFKIEQMDQQALDHMIDAYNRLDEAVQNAEAAIVKITMAHVEHQTERTQIAYEVAMAIHGELHRPWRNES